VIFTAEHEKHYCTTTVIFYTNNMKLKVIDALTLILFIAQQDHLLVSPLYKHYDTYVDMLIQ
jgi:hypothetical protein